MHEGRLAGRRDHRRAVLELAVVGEDDVEHRLRELGVEAVDRLDRAADQVVAERDLAEQPAGVGEVDRQRIVVVGLGLADVVQQRPGDRDVAVDPGEGAGRGADRLGDRDRVVEQPVRGRPGGSTSPPARPGSGARSASRGRRSRSSSARSCGFWIVASSSRSRASSSSTETGGPSTRSSCSYSPSSATRIERIVILAPYWGWTEKRPSMKTTAPGAQQLEAARRPPPRRPPRPTRCGRRPRAG